MVQCLGFCVPLRRWSWLELRLGMWYSYNSRKSVSPNKEKRCQLFFQVMQKNSLKIDWEKSISNANFNKNSPFSRLQLHSVVQFLWRDGCDFHVQVINRRTRNTEINSVYFLENFPKLEIQLFCMLLLFFSAFSTFTRRM